MVSSAPRGAVRYAHAEGVLDGSDRLRDRGLRHVEMDAGLRHAAVLRNGEENVQVAKPHPAADPAVPVDSLGH